MPEFAHRVRYSYAQYLELEDASNVRHEYLDGQIYGMAGGTPEHAALAAAFIGLLYAQVARSGCRTHSSDLRVRVPATGLATYPDITIVCGEREVHPEDANALTNPTLIAEVLSDSTEQYDAGEKFEHYRQLAALRQYVLIAQDRPRVVVRTRTPDGTWTERSYADGETVDLPSINATLAVDELYAATTA